MQEGLDLNTMKAFLEIKSPFLVLLHALPWPSCSSNRNYQVKIITSESPNSESVSLKPTRYKRNQVFDDGESGHRQAKLEISTGFDDFYWVRQWVRLFLLGSQWVRQWVRRMISTGFEKWVRRSLLGLTSESGLRWWLTYFNQVR